MEHCLPSLGHSTGQSASEAAVIGRQAFLRDSDVDPPSMYPYFQNERAQRPSMGNVQRNELLLTRSQDRRSLFNKAMIFQAIEHVVSQPVRIATEALVIKVTGFPTVEAMLHDGLHGDALCGLHMQHLFDEGCRLPLSSPLIRRMEEELT